MVLLFEPDDDEIAVIAAQQCLPVPASSANKKKKHVLFEPFRTQGHL